MRKRLIPLLIGLVVAATMGTHEALADMTSSQQPNQLAIRLGAFFPGSSDARDFGGSTQLLGGLDYTLSTTHGKSPSAAGVYFDYLSGTQHSGYVHAGGLGLQFRSMGPGYIGAGLGVYNTAVRTPSGEVSGNSTGGGGKVFVGYEFGNQALLQLDYHFAPTALGVNPNGLGVEFGYRL